MPSSGVCIFGLKNADTCAFLKVLMERLNEDQNNSGKFSPHPSLLQTLHCAKTSRRVPVWVSVYGWAFPCRIYNSLLPDTMSGIATEPAAPGVLLQPLPYNQNYALTLSLGILLCLDRSLENGRAVRHLPPILCLTFFPYKNPALCSV